MKNDIDPEEMTMTPELMAAAWSMHYCRNAEFRAEFDADPKEALGRLCGVPVPDEATIVVHRRQPKEIHVVLPEVDASQASLSAHETEGINAGVFPTTISGMLLWQQAARDALRKRP